MVDFLSIVSMFFGWRYISEKSKCRAIWSSKNRVSFKIYLFNSRLGVSMCCRLTDSCLALCSSIFCVFFFHEFIHLYRTVVLSPVFLCWGGVFQRFFGLEAFFGRAKRRLFKWSIVEPPHCERSIPRHTQQKWRRSFGDSRNQTWLGSTPHARCQWLNKGLFKRIP